MEEDLIEELKHKKLTKEEETQIAISGEGRRELIEECELRNDTYQFKFSSEYQMRWVENNGPWNFENNLLLLKRWEQGMTAYNISFTHSPFWLQIWGLPFDMMSEKIGRDIGNSIGNFMAADSKSWSSDQTKFMRIRVNIPLDRPLRQCEVVASPEGEKFQVYFRYERLLVFCFLCGVMGHDVRHCPCLERQTEELPQYGDWLRAQEGSKIGSQKKDQAKITAMGQNAPPEIAGKGDQDAERRSLETSGNPEKQKVSRNSASISDTDSDLSNSLFQIQIQNTKLEK
ncbi:uncharacterized protein LOC115951510 [Quercus lobata]|uniref:uncharacterized protein LOC115951510 n=1 Tax=Quercus lobata TaxID=97700 RepID=UPI00124430FF|nr:uncharacterized protein LOC115951510 [Quercus lobata]